MLGRTFTLKDEKDNGIGAPSLGNGLAGNFTKTPGFVSYYECCALRKTKDWTTVWLSQSKIHYMFNKSQWIYFYDIKSFHLRVRCSIISNMHIINKLLLHRLPMWLQKNWVDCLFGH